MTHTQNPEEPLPLPAEITTEILKQVIWEDDETLTAALAFYDINGYLRHRLMTPLTLGAVCRSWRKFVWDTPSLWSFIALPAISKTYHTHQLFIIDTFLERSKTHSLSIWLSYASDDIPDPDHVNVILQKLVDHSPRWRRLLMCLRPEITDILSQVKGRVPLLQECELRWEDYREAALPMTPLDMFEDAPHLRRFTFNADFFPFDTDSMTASPINKLTLPWAQLEYFDGEHISGKTLVMIANRCTNLTELIIADAYLNNHDFSYDGTFSLPNLRSLVITNTTEKHHVEYILQHLRCPQLRRLHIRMYRTAEALSFSEVEDFMTKSNCAVDDLQLQGVFNLSLFPVFLERQPSLKVLRISSVHSEISRKDQNHECPLCNRDDIHSFLDNLLTKLDLTTADKSVYLPNLTDLNCRIYPHVPSSAPLPTPLDLLNVLQQRWNPPDGVSRVERVVLQDTFALDESQDSIVGDGLRDLVRKGMKISWNKIELSQK